MKSRSTLILIVVTVLLLLVGISCLCVYLVGRNIRDLDINLRSEEETDDQTSKDQSDDNQEQDEEMNEDIEPQRYAVVASGASHDATHYEWYKYSTRLAYDVLLEHGYKDENIYFLFENSSEKDVDYESNYENFTEVVGELENKTTYADQILFFLIGHGSFDGVNSYYELTDYNISDTEFAGLLSDVNRERLVVVLSPCNTGGFIDDLSGGDTVVITSTRADEANQAAFIEPFLMAFRKESDEDAFGTVSFADAFNIATLDVKTQYERRGWGLVTEHPQLDDNGDHVSHEAPMPSGGDGKLAGETYL